MGINNFTGKGLCTVGCLLLVSCSSNNQIKFLDYAASSPINEKALAEFNTVSRMDGNSSGINPHAKNLLEIEKRSAEVIARKINAKSDQIVFTSGATMSNNIAILGVARNYPRCHMITTKIEHKSVLNVFKYLESMGYRITYLDVDRFGRINLQQLLKSIGKDTKLISIQTFNSEIGTLQDMKSIGEISRKHGILFHSDAAQAFCKYDMDVDESNFDLLSVSGHKIGAPKGIAALYVRDVEQLQPILFGSGDRFFPGTKPTALIAAFASAVEDSRFDREKTEKNFHALISELSKIDDVYINSAVPSHVLSVSIGGVLLKDLLEQIKDYSFSSGCSCLGQGQSNVISAIDPEKKLPSCTIRISFSDKVSSRDLIEFAQHLKRTVIQLRSGKSVGLGCQGS